MDDILAKKNRHLFLEEKDNVGNSFIANVNKVAESADVWLALKDHEDEIVVVSENIDDIHTVAENIDSVNIVADNIDDIEFVHSNIEDGTLEALLDRISNEGNDWLLRIAALGNRLLNSKNAFNYAAVATIPSDIAANATITLPESMSYLVGTHMLLLSWNGTVCYKDEQYKEIGTADTWSTTIKTLVPLKAGDKLEFRTVAVVPADTQVIATGSLENRTLADRFGDVCNVKDFGAVGDGVENDTEAFQNALATGKAVFVPEGSYKLTTNLTGDFCSTGNSTFTGGTINGSTILRGIAQKNNDIINVKDFGAKGNGETDDTAVFSNLGSIFTNKRIDLLGLTYLVSSIPQNNYYYNGKWKVSTKEYDAYNNNILTIDTNRGGTWIGKNPEINLYDWEHYRDFFVATPNGLQNTDNILSVIAIGNNCLSDGEVGQFTIAIGDSALKSLNGGTRNTAIGTLSLLSVTTGERNTGLGRDTGQNITTGSNNVCLGYGAMAGWCPITLNGTIEKSFSMTGSDTICIGSNSGQFLTTGTRSIYEGLQAGENIKTGNYNVVLGVQALNAAQKNTSFNGKVYSNLSTPVSNVPYVVSGTTITVTLSGHSAVQDCYVKIGFNTGTLKDDATSDVQFLYVTSVDGDDFIFTSPKEYNGSGTCTIYGYEQSTSSTEAGSASTVVGTFAGLSAAHVSNTNLIGYSSGKGPETLNDSDVFGVFAGNSAKTLERCVFIGTQTGNAVSGSGSSGTRCTAVGADAMRYMQDGSTATTVSYATCIGASSRVSGSNQIQLGYSTETTYAYGAVQDRSDARDKADVRDTVLGLDFIKALHPVDFKWDYRDDYIEIIENEESGEAEVVKHEKDGSKKRSRYHHGLIAQEVKTVLDEKGIDFGGYQDHRINGGADVLTLGYEEFIAPMIKAIQELNNQLQTSNTKIEALMQRISALENNQ